MVCELSLSVLQLAFMAAYYGLHGAMPPVYEACATRKFFHGRTETIRSATEAATAFCKALASGAPKEETQALMQVRRNSPPSSTLLHPPSRHQPLVGSGKLSPRHVSHAHTQSTRREVSFTPTSRLSSISKSTCD